MGLFSKIKNMFKKDNDEEIVKEQVEEKKEEIIEDSDDSEVEIEGSIKEKAF